MVKISVLGSFFKIYVWILINYLLNYVLIYEFQSITAEVLNLKISEILRLVVTKFELKHDCFLCFVR